MAKLFEYGGVECVCSDNSTRQFAMKIDAPWCVIQPIVSMLLGHGFIDNLVLKQPLMAWAPTLPQNKFSDSALVEVPNIDRKVNMIVQERVEEILRLFSDLASILRNPDDAIWILPMGSYVTFQFRSTYDEFAMIIGKIGSVNSPGILELRYAFASVLAELLIGAGDIGPLEFDTHDIPPVLCSPVDDHAAKLTPPTLPASVDDSSGKDG